jgi:hypothetical protein
MINQKLINEIKLQLEIMKITTKKIKRNATTNKETGGRYPIPTGYSKYTRRPVLDIIKWIELMETTLEMILEELE